MVEGNAKSKRFYLKIRIITEAIIPIVLYSYLIYTLN